MKNIPILFLFLLVLAGCGEKKPEAATPDTAADTSSVTVQLEKLNAKITATPGDAALLHERARIYIDMKRYQDALGDMQKVMTIDSTKSIYFLTMADLSFAANRTYDAKTNLERALLIDSVNTDAMMRLAELNLIVRQYSASVNLLTKVLEKDKSNTTAWLMRGINFKENGDTVRAINDFRSAIEADPNYYNAYMQLGILYQLKNDPIAEGYFTRE